jgi:putative redox protein
VAGVEEQKMDVNLVWKDGMELVGHADTGHQVTMDASAAVGGQNNGFRPTALIAIGAAGCASMDVLSILRKKKVEFSGFECKVNVESYQEAHPHVFTKMHFEYIVTGKNIQRKDVERAVELAETKYCQGIAMMSKTAEIVHTITIIEE